MTPLTADLFGAPLLPGFDYRDELVGREEAAELIARIDAETLSPFRFQAWLGKRLTRSFGWRYDFDRGGMGETDPIPDWLQALRGRAASFAGLTEAELVQALLIRDDPDAGIGWHRDRPVFEHVVGISLGVPATMRFRRRRPGAFDRSSAPLSSRSVYHLSGEVRHGWEHSIANMDATRWSITFRSLADSAISGTH